MNRQAAITTNVDISEYHKTQGHTGNPTTYDADGDVVMQDVFNKWDKSKGNKNKTISKLGEYFDTLRNKSNK